MHLKCKRNISHKYTSDLLSPNRSLKIHWTPETLHVLM